MRPKELEMEKQQQSFFLCPECGEYSARHSARDHAAKCSWPIMLARLQTVRAKVRAPRQTVPA